MRIQVEPSSLRGEIQIPPSKSETMRALVFGAMGKGRTEVRSPLISPDVLAMVKALEGLGASMQRKEGGIDIQGVNGKVSSLDRRIDAGNSGIVLRFIGALSGLSSASTLLLGDLSLQERRPLQPLIHALHQMGVKALALGTPGYAPVAISGPMRPGRVCLEGRDSQPVSALLIASSFLQEPTHITVDHPGEKPWIDLTLHWMRQVGLVVDNEGYHTYRVQGRGQYEGFSVEIPGDWSSAAFPLAAALVTRSSLTLQGLKRGSYQGDERIVDLLQAMGAGITWEGELLHITPAESLRGLIVDVNDSIDALPILAVLGCYADTPMELINGQIARVKESDRIHVMAVELRKMGAQIEERPDGLKIYPSPLTGALVEGHADHRVAMAMTIAALGARGSTQIDGVQWIGKSFPTFVEDFIGIGARIQHI